jgi:antitoxin MazE
MSEGEDLIFRVDENGQVIVERAINIPASQAWFWTERWQKMEREVQEDIESGRIHHSSNVDEALADLEKTEDAGNPTE